MLNLSTDWLSIFLPHVQKINRLSAAHVLMIPSLTVALPNPTLPDTSRSYGVMTSTSGTLVQQPGMPMTRAKLSIPFIGDVPSPS